MPAIILITGTMNTHTRPDRGAPAPQWLRLLLLRLPAPLLSHLSLPIAARAVPARGQGAHGTAASECGVHA